MFWDKLVDGIFIFLGVYIAFAFGQYQEDKRNKKELEYHLGQIMEKLSEKEPNESVQNFKYNVKESIDPKSKKVTCSLNFNTTIDDLDILPPHNIEAIFENGLSKYMKSKTPLSLLSSLVFEYQPNLIEAQKKFAEIATTELFQFLDASKKSRNKTRKRERKKGECLKNKKYKEMLRAAEERISPYYVQYMMYKGLAQQTSYQALKELKKNGYKASKSEKIDINFNMKFDNKNKTESKKTKGEKFKTDSELH